MKQALVWNHISPGHHPPDGNLSKLPEYVDLNFLDLYKDEKTKFGLKLSVLYYENWDEETDKYSNPVAKVIWQTQFDTTQNPPLPTKQIQKVGWRLTDGKWSEDKIKVIPVRNPKVFLQKMRGRVIEELIDIATKFGLKDQILGLYENYQSEIILYKEGGSQKFRKAIATSNEEWLGKVIPATGNKPRDVIVQYLSIGVMQDEAD